MDIKQNDKTKKSEANSGTISSVVKSKIKEDEDAYEKKLCECISKKYKFVGLGWADEEIVLGTVAKYLKKGKEDGYDTFTLIADNEQMLLTISKKQRE
jgi:hypothetical protein